MPTTARGIWYPESSNNLRIWEILDAMAESIDEAIDKSSIYVGEDERTTSSAAVTTTETVIQSCTFTSASTTARYRVTAIQSVQSTVLDDVIQVRLRWAAAGSVTTAGAQIFSTFPNADRAGKGVIVPLVKSFVPAVAGQVTVGVTIVRSIGTGSISSFGSAAQINSILVEKG